MDFSTILDLSISLLTLTFLEVVLAIDNLVFISVLSSRLKEHQRARIRRLGLLLAWVFRLLFLASALWITKLTRPLFELFDHGVSFRDLFLIGGGLFLLLKATQEMHNEVQELEHEDSYKKFSSPMMAIVQIGILDVIFSFDSIITAVGLTRNYYIMATAITIAILTMVFLSDYLSKLINKHPTIKMLALSFLLLIGTILVADGFGFEIPRGYIYFSICFALFVEVMNNLKRQRHIKKR